jgi:hypothetical protein
MVTDISLLVKEKDMANMNFILSPYPYTDDTILRKNRTNALIYVNTTLFTPLHPYMSQPSGGLPQGVLTEVVSRVKKMCPDVDIRLHSGVLYVTWRWA